jgi:hypothetical protein
MNLLDNLKNVAQGSLNRLRGAVPMISPAPRAQAPVAISTNQWLPTYLEPEDFRAGNWKQNEWSNVAYFKCDETARYRLIGGAPVSMYIRSYRAYDVTVVSGARTRILDDLIDGSLGNSSIEILVFHRAGTVWTQGALTSATYDASGIGGSIVYAEPAGTEQTEVYYLGGVGEFRFRAIRSLGGVDDSAVLLWNESFNAIHTINQKSNRSTPIWGRDFDLVPGYTLAFEVKTPNAIKFTPRSRHILAINTQSTDIAVLGKTALNAAVELQTRGGI